MYPPENSKIGRARLPPSHWAWKCRMLKPRFQLGTNMPALRLGMPPAERSDTSKIRKAIHARRRSRMAKTKNALRIIDRMIGDDELRRLVEQATINAHVAQLIL
jgi:predicted RNA-binding protein